VIVGMPGVGKTTLAAQLGAHWGVGALDTDDLIAERAHQATAAYLREVGEVAFRQTELEALRDALGHDVVVATGAGVVTTKPARTLLAHERTLWLDCDDEILALRVVGGDRPLLEGPASDALATLRAERAPWYEECASVRVDASGTPDEVLERVVHVLEGASA